MNTFGTYYRTLFFLVIFKVGPPDMYSNHQKLKEARTNARQHEQSYKNLNDHLEQEKQKNARLEQDVKNYEERQKFLGTIKIMEMKRPWVVSN